MARTGEGSDTLTGTGEGKAKGAGEGREGKGEGDRGRVLGVRAALGSAYLIGVPEKHSPLLSSKHSWKRCDAQARRAMSRSAR